jgi:hypothetical protein
LTNEQAANLILGIVGVALSLIFKYWPAAEKWYEAQPNKGLLMLGFCVIVAGVYFALACTSLAAMLGIQIACDLPSVYILAQAIFIIAAPNQLAHLFTRTSKKPSY